MISKTFLTLLILFSFSCFMFPHFRVSAIPNIINVPTYFTTIQAAINNASYADTIFIHEGTYYENIVVNKTVSILGENRENSIIDANGTGTAVKITVENVTVHNLTIRGGGSSAYESGILLDASFANVTGNVITGNNLGICLNYSSENFITGNMVGQNRGDGVSLFSSFKNWFLENIIAENRFGFELVGSGQNVILNNTLTENLVGANLFYSPNNFLINNILTRNIENGIVVDFSSDNNTLTGNIITATAGYGLTLGSNTNNILRNNSLNANTYNFYCPATRPNLADYLNDIDDSNTVNGKQIRYIIDKAGLLIEPSTFSNTGYLALVNCTNMTVQNLEFSENGQGLLVAFTNDSIVRNLTTTKNKHGIQLLSSVNNTLTGNTLIGNSGDGITLDYSSNENRVHSNTIENNENGIRMIHNTDENRITDNQIINNTMGFWIYSFNIHNTIKNNVVTGNKQGITMARGCVNNTITQNTVEGNNEGINFSGSSRNVVFCNNFISNTTPAVMLDSTNLWDVGYPGGGNFWSDYLWVDVYWGPSQDRPGSDGIGDTPYTIDSQNQDRYPLISPISATQDQNPPFVGLPSRTPETEIGPSQEVEVSVIAIDRESGLKNVTLWYSVDDGSIWYPLTMEYNLSSSLYQTVIPTQQAFAQVKYRIVAFDNSANKAEQDNVGQYFTYKVIPEYATTMIAVIFIVLTTSAFLSSRKHRPDCAKKKTRV